MKKILGLTASLMFISFVLWSCGGGGGGGGTTNNDPAGGCATYENNAFTGDCQDYYGIPASDYQTGCTEDNTSTNYGVFYSGGCPATIGSSTRIGSCTKNLDGGFKSVWIYYSPELSIETAKNACSYMGGTWSN